MSQIKVRAGQVWECVNETLLTGVGCHRIILSACDNYVDFSTGTRTLKLHDNFKFVPQTDLETLAVKLDKWYCAAAWLRIIQGVPFICEEFDEGAINEQQWQNMRYYLGLDKKPHCKLVDGEWVKQ